MATKEPISPSTRRTANEKRDIVLRVLRGESIVAQWRDDFIEAGTEGLKSRPVSLAEKRLKVAQAKIGELSVQVEILQQYLKKKGRAHTFLYPSPQNGVSESTSLMAPNSCSSPDTGLGAPLPAAGLL